MRGSLPVGTVVKGYRIESVLSEAGNFATVYLARDTDAARVERRREKVAGRLGRWQERYGPQAARTPIDPGPQVALKEYAPRELSERRGLDVYARPDKQRVFEWGRDRFKRESEFLAEHSHPNIVAVFDYFSMNSTEYYVMEHLTGGSLGDQIQKRGCQGETQIRGWLMPILDGLASVERRGASHLDISPGNIMFRRPGGDAVLVDFGAARLPGGSVAGHSTRLIVDEHFAAPEKFKQTSRDLDSRSDTYSLGAVVNYALTGEYPKSGERRLAGSSEMSASAARARASRGGAEFLRAIDRAFSVIAAERFADAAGFADALRHQRRSSSSSAVVEPQRNGLRIILIIGGASLAILLLVIAWMVLNS